MKKTLILLAALTFTTAGTSFAQTAPATAHKTHQGSDHKGKEHKTPAQKADHHAAKMAKDLGLTADQEARVEQLLVARQQESAALKAKYGTDKKAGRTDMQASRQRYQTELKSILTADQYAKMSQMKDEHRGQGKMKNGGKTKVKTKA